MEQGTCQTNGQASIAETLKASDVAQGAWVLFTKDAIAQEYELSDRMEKTLASFRPLAIRVAFNVGILLFVGVTPCHTRLVCSILSKTVPPRDPFMIDYKQTFKDSVRLYFLPFAGARAAVHEELRRQDIERNVGQGNGFDYIKMARASFRLYFAPVLGACRAVSAELQRDNCQHRK